MTYYTPDMIKFIRQLRREGYSWSDVASEFEEEFGDRKSPDTIRVTYKNLEREQEVDEEEFDLGQVQSNPKKPLPDYLLYTPKKSFKKNKVKSKGTALIIPDCHIPYHDQRAYELMLKVARDTPNLKEIVILGDYADFYAVSSHGKHPQFTHVLVDEVSQVRRELERLAEMFPDVRRVFISGNHEYRLERYISDRAPDLFGVVDTPTILQLDQLGYEFVPYNANQKHAIMGSKLYARHEPIGGGEHAAASTVNKAGCSMVFGHVHKIQQYRKVFIDQADHLAASVGWLGNKDHPVMGYLKNHAQWQLGFAFAHVMDNGNFFLDINHIIEYTTYYNGKLYRG